MEGIDLDVLSPQQAVELLDSRIGHAHRLVQHNGGVFLPPWGKVEQWLVSVQHQDEDIDRFVANFKGLLQKLS